MLQAIAAVPRERFVLPADAGRAYENVALPIPGGQTISQPLVVARMLQLLDVGRGDRVLDVGTGSGYHAALLARLGAQVISIERIGELAAAAAAVLRDLGLEGVEVLVGDGSLGLPERAPFDAINVAAASPELPLTLAGQLALGGRLVAPVGDREQCLVLLRRTESGVQEKRLEPVRFVPLVPDEGSVDEPQG